MSGRNSKSYFFSNKTSNGNQFKRFAARSDADKPDGSNAIALINSRLNGTVGTHLGATNTSSIGGTVSTSTTTKASSKAGATSSGWMTVKRRGVDDELIKRDAQKAKLDRLKQFQKGRTQRMKLLRKEVQQKQYKQQKAKKTNSKTKQSWKKRQESSEDEESFSSGSSTEEEIILTSSSSDEESQPMEGEDEDDEDIKSPVPLPTGRTRSHSKPNIAYSKRRSSYTATNDLVIDVDQEEEEEVRHQKDVQASNSEDDSLFLSKPTFSQTKNQTQSLKNSIHNEKTEPAESKGRCVQGNNNQPKRRILDDSSSEDEDDDYKSTMKLAIKRSLSENNSHGYLSEDIPEEERRALEIAQKRSLEEYRNSNNLTQSDTQWLLESTSPAAASRFKRLKKQNSSCNENNNSSQVLLGKQFKGTTNHFQKNSKTKTMKKGSDKTDEVQYYSDDSSSSSDATRGTDENNDDAMSFHGGDDEEDGAINDEATTVLETVNELSSRVLHRMQAFCNHLQETNSEKTTTSVQGMIVDGALAMSTFATTAEEEAANNEKALVSRDALSKCLSTEMVIHDYQLIGVNWMALMNTLECYDNRQGKKGKRRAKSNVNGVLADEMGLGKTVQTIAFLAWLKYGNTNKRKKENLSIVPSSSAHDVINLDDDSTTDDGEDDLENNQPALSNQATCPHLIVVPASVLSNWMREFEKVCPGLVVQIYHGTQEERMNLRSELRKRQEGSPDIDVILTTFSYFSNEKNDDRKFLGKIKFDYMVVDEAHSLKNPKGKRYQELDRIKTSHRLLLTGTPIQNNPGELLALLCFLMPLFQTRGDDVANDGGVKLLEQITKSSRNGKNKLNGFITEEDRVYGDLKQLLAPFILRRRKVDVIRQALPPKIHKVEMVPFDESTRNLYDSILRSHISGGNTVTEVESITADASKCKNIFTLLRKAANHPLLLRTRHTSPEAIEELSNHLFNLGYFGSDKSCTIQLVRSELEGFSDFDIHLATLDILDECPSMRDSLSKYTLTEEDLFCSPKFKRLKVLLPSLLEQDHRVLIFSQWTRCLDLLGCFLESLQMRFLRLDGQTGIGERQKLIDKFNNDATIPVFLLSTRAGGMGINLTSADTVICHDLDFNPFNDLQAEDRCHRIGQTKQVTVYKMITEGTVDDDIYAMQKRKAEMTAAIFSHENGSSSAQEKNVGGMKAPYKQEKEDISSIMKVTLDRFLSSPSKNHITF